ncbi:MAG: antibiotic biosynthesis monooxygenase [Chloroflexi bacterium RBG_16_68_14]|nr:MAG: antibiotic biosynthesis monooxygenase [Chloroflexi bacterium RBG_16_68_14]
MFIAMNNFKVAKGREEEFERAWRERQSYLEEVPGFLQFALLRADAEGEYISHTTWRDRAAFVAWTQSEAFVKGHRQGSLAGLLEGPPQLKTYQAVIVETPEGRAVPAS